jgi:hypothetical protein
MIFHNKVAIQTKEHYIKTNNLTILHWAVIYRVLTKLTSLVRQQGGVTLNIQLTIKGSISGYHKQH